MNEQERLQRIIDILADNAHAMCYIENGSENAIIDADMDGVQTVAREICNVFRHVPKETRSKREQLLDVQFERMGVKPRVYHFTDIPTFKAVTIAVIAKEDTYAMVHTYILKMYTIGIEPATTLLENLRSIKICGVAICDKSDVFSRRYGRMKAKGKLIQHLLKEEKK